MQSGIPIAYLVKATVRFGVREYGVLWPPFQRLFPLQVTSNQSQYTCRKTTAPPRHLSLHSSRVPILTVFQCDQIDPACSQCLRAGKACPGYRDQLSLLFRDESEKVVRKAKIPKSTAEHRKHSRVQVKPIPNSDGSVSTSPTTSVTSPNTSSQVFVAPTTALLIRSLTPECLDEGVIFFFQNYGKEKVSLRVAGCLSFLDISLK